MKIRSAFNIALVLLLTLVFLSNLDLQIFIAE
jgi:hypothetical protein